MKTAKIEIGLKIYAMLKNYGKIILSNYRKNSVLSVIKVATTMFKKNNNIKIKKFTLFHSKKNYLNQKNGYVK